MITTQALIFAAQAHRGQARKYTGEPYIHHPVEVAGILFPIDSDPNVIAAAYLHDVVEDTDVEIEDIESRFGQRVRDLVWAMTDQGVGNRATRKAFEVDRWSRQNVQAKNLKLADLISNTWSIVRYDPDFAKVFRSEMRALIDVFGDADASLLARAKAAAEWTA